MKLKVQKRYVYGRPLFYPMCDLSQQLARCGKRVRMGDNEQYTLSGDLIRILQRIGIQFEFVPIPQEEA